MTQLSVRALTPLDAALYRELRLEALRDAPETFASSYEEELERPLALAVERVTPKDDGSRVFGAFLGGRLVGMTGLYRERQRKLRHKGHVWGVFVRPEARGRGCGRALFRALIDHARTLPDLTQLQLGVSVGNAPALALYLACGFRTYGTEPAALVVDGVALDEDLMVLKL